MSKPPAKGRRGRVYAAYQLSGHPFGFIRAWWWKVDFRKHAMNDNTTPNDVWYYAKDGTTFGPFTRAELLEKAGERIVTSETLVIQQGETEWKPLASIESDGSAPSAGSDALAPAPKGKPSLSTRDKILGYGCLFPLFLFAALALVSDFIGGKGDEETTPTFEFTADSFREAFVREVAIRNLNHRFQTKSWNLAKGERGDHVTVLFENDKLGLLVVLDTQTKKIKDISAFMAPDADNEVEGAANIMILPVVVVAAIAPDLLQEDKKKVHQVIMETAKNKGKPIMRQVGPLLIKAEFLPTLGLFQFYIEPNR